MRRNSKKPADNAKRDRDREYLRRYRREHPEKVAQWRRNYIIAAYERMKAAQGGADGGRD